MTNTKRLTGSRHLRRVLAATSVAALLGVSLFATAGVASATGGAQGCDKSLFRWDVQTGENAYPMVLVHVWAKDDLPQNCTLSFSLNSYEAEGPTWKTSGTQSLVDHQSITLSPSHQAGTLSVTEPACFGQTDFYVGTTKYDGKDGALPHYPNTVTPYGLISYSNGGKACETTTTTTSSTTTDETTTDETTTEETTTDQTTSTDETTTDETTTDETTTDETTTDETTTDETTTDQTTSTDETTTDETTTDQTTTSSDTTSSETTSSETTSTKTKSEPTPPSTDTITTTGGSSSGGMSPLLLLVFAGFLGGALLVVPSKARNRR